MTFGDLLAFFFLSRALRAASATESVNDWSGSCRGAALEIKPHAAMTVTNKHGNPLRCIPSSSHFRAKLILRIRPRPRTEQPRLNARCESSNVPSREFSSPCRIPGHRKPNQYVYYQGQLHRSALRLRELRIERSRLILPDANGSAVVLFYFGEELNCGTFEPLRFSGPWCSFFFPLCPRQRFPASRLPTPTRRRLLPIVRLPPKLPFPVCPRPSAPRLPPPIPSNTPCPRTATKK